MYFPSPDLWDLEISPTGLFCPAQGSMIRVGLTPFENRSPGLALQRTKVRADPEEKYIGPWEKPVQAPGIEEMT